LPSNILKAFFNLGVNIFHWKPHQDLFWKLS